MVILFMQYLIIFLISMVPLIELRGAIPYAIGFKTSAIAILHHLYPWKYASSAIYLFYLQERFSCGEVIKSTLAASSTGVLKKEREAERSFRKRQEEAFMWHCFCL